ncbi:hypothetical protein Ddc_07393 [Ditylenchus destructor]|nr:hypothetical protein Ddc_07393 [Ditylenchus destructor]
MSGAFPDKVLPPPSYSFTNSQDLAEVDKLSEVSDSNTIHTNAPVMICSCDKPVYIVNQENSEPANCQCHSDSAPTHELSFAGNNELIQPPLDSQIEPSSNTPCSQIPNPCSGPKECKTCQPCPSSALLHKRRGRPSCHGLSLDELDRSDNWLRSPRKRSRDYAKRNQRSFIPGCGFSLPPLDMFPFFDHMYIDCYMAQLGVPTHSVPHFFPPPLFELFAGPVGFRDSRMSLALSTKALDVDPMYQFVLFVTGCDLRGEECRERNGFNMGTKVKVVGPLCDRELAFEDVMGNRVKATKQGDNIQIEIKTNMGTTLKLYEYGDRRLLCADDAIGNYLVVAEDVRNRLVKRADNMGNLDSFKLRVDA